jgi:uncharacterized membrane protein
VAFANPIPSWALALVIAAAALVAWQCYRRFAVAPHRRAVLTALRFATLIALVLFLLRPVSIRTEDAARDVVVPILVDTSRSMAIEDLDGQRRIDRARDLLSRALLPQLEPRFKTEVLAFGEKVTARPVAELAATGRRSDVAAALAEVAERYRGRPVAGIVLLSDGGDTSGILADPRDLPAPVFPLGIGATRVGRDREVLSVTAAEAVLDDSRVDLAVSAVSHGYGAAPIQLRLLENGRPVEVRRVAPAADGAPVRAVFQVTPQAGAPTIYTVEIPEASGELAPENNARSALVQPPSRPRRILLVEGAPGFEHSFLKRAWANDPGLEVDSVIRKGKNEQGNDTFYIQAARSRGDALASGYPTTPEALFAYDALVLANVERNQLTRAQLDATRAFVAARGGGLLVLGARSFLKQGLGDTPIEEVVPLDLSDRAGAVVQVSASRGLHRLSLTAAGERHPIMQLAADLDESRRRWEAAPALASTAPLGGPRPGASVLAVTAGTGGSARALVAVQRYGEGRSMIFTGEAAWRWRMMLPSSDRSYDTFWRQAARWLALPAGDPVQITVPAGAAAGDVFPVRVAVRNAAYVAQRDARVDIQITAPDGRVDRVAAAAGTGDDEGRFVARYRAEQPGVYRVVARTTNKGADAGAASASMLVGGADLEMTDPRLNTQVLQHLAVRSGGAMIDERDTAALVAALRTAAPSAALAVRQDLWHNAWSFLAIIVLLASEWILRRRWGLR